MQNNLLALITFLFAQKEISVTLTLYPFGRETSIGKGPYQNYKRNGLYCVPINKKSNQALVPKPILVAIAPPDAEFTGPCWGPIFEKETHNTLFLSIQHPNYKNKIFSRSCVIQIRVPKNFLNAIGYSK